MYLICMYFLICLFNLYYLITSLIILKDFIYFDFVVLIPKYRLSQSQNLKSSFLCYDWLYWAVYYMILVNGSLTLDCFYDFYDSLLKFTSFLYSLYQLNIFFLVNIFLFLSLNYVFYIFWNAKVPLFIYITYIC